MIEHFTSKLIQNNKLQCHHNITVLQWQFTLVIVRLTNTGTYFPFPKYFIYMMSLYTLSTCKEILWKLWNPSAYKILSPNDFVNVLWKQNVSIWICGKLTEKKSCNLVLDHKKLNKLNMKYILSRDIHFVLEI